MDLFVHKNGQQSGPFSLTQIQAGLAAGSFNSADLAWHEGLAGWVPLAQIAGVKTSGASPAFLETPPPYRPKRPILATVISILYFVISPFGLLFLLAVPDLANLNLPGTEGTRGFYQSFNGIDYTLSAALMVMNLVGAVFLFLMRRPALCCFACSFCLNLAYQVRMVFFKNISVPGPGKSNPITAMMQQSMQSSMYMGFIFGIGISGALVYYVWHLNKRGQLRR